MRLPRPIYESIPSLYILGGLVSLILIDAPFSLISAALFGCASWMVWRMRKDYRNDKAISE